MPSSEALLNLRPFVLLFFQFLSGANRRDLSLCNPRQYRLSRTLILFPPCKILRKFLSHSDFIISLLLLRRRAAEDLAESLWRLSGRRRHRALERERMYM